MSIENLKQRIRTFKFADFSEPVASTEIENAQRAIGLPFGREYQQFLEHLGSGGVDSEEFIGLGGHPHLNVVQMCEDLRHRSRPLPKHLIPLRADGFGNYDCSDTSTRTENGEFAVVRWLHDGGPDQTYERLASSYFEWFDSVLDRIQEELS